MKLSEALRAGIAVSLPAKWSLLLRDRQGKLMACALGACHIGRGGDPYMSFDDINLSLYKTWTELGRNATNPVTSEQTTLEFVIWDLNDSHNWSREQIADWLEGLGY